MLCTLYFKRVHAEYQLNTHPDYPFWFTPAQFSGRLVVDYDCQHVYHFELKLPTDNQLNIGIYILIYYFVCSTTWHALTSLNIVGNKNLLVGCLSLEEFIPTLENTFFPASSCFIFPFPMFPYRNKLYYFRYRYGMDHRWWIK